MGHLSLTMNICPSPLSLPPAAGLSLIPEPILAPLLFLTCDQDLGSVISVLPTL